MPFRPAFDCLWCGTPHATRDPQDLEGWSQLCPACLAKAGTNQFLRFRLKAALAERAAEGGGPHRAEPAPAGAAADPEDAPDPRDAPGAGVNGLGGASGSIASPSHPVSAGSAPGGPGPGPARSPFSVAAAPDQVDDFYLRRRAFARGPIHDAAWNAELDAAGRWLDGVPFRGEVVELAAGTGWWSALLAGKVALSLFDESPARLERARERLVAHRLRAHLHPRDRWAVPDHAADGLFVGPAIVEVPAARLGPFAALLHDWLRPGGVLALIDLLPDGLLDATGRPFGRAHEPVALPAALAAVGFTAIESGTTGQSFTLVTARA